MGKMGWAVHTAISSPPAQQQNQGKARLASPKEPPPSYRDSCPPHQTRVESTGGNEGITKQVAQRNVTRAGMGQVCLPSGCPSIRPEGAQRQGISCCILSTQPRYSLSIDLGLSFPHL